MPQQPVMFSSCWSPAWSQTAPGWHLIRQPAFIVCQPTWLCWSPWKEQHTQADPTSVQWGWGQDCWKAIPSSPLPNSAGCLLETPLSGDEFVILEVRVQSQTVELWDGHWLQNLISISLCIEIASNDNNPCFPVREMPPHTITLPALKDVSRSVHQSA